MPRTTKHLVDGTLIHQIEPGMLQVGSNPRHSVVLSGLDPAEITWINSLLDKDVAGVSSVSNQEHLTARQTEALHLLDAAGLLTDGSNPFQSLRIRIVGLDETGIRVARLLAQAKVGHLEVRDTRFVGGDCELLFPSSAKGLSRERAMREEIRDTSPLTCLGKIAMPDLVIACSNRTVDFGTLGVLLSHDIPHLPVVTDDRTISVGPLVMPGKTACSLCVELHNWDRTPGFPEYSGSLRRSGTSAAVPYISAMAAGVVMSMVDAVIHGRISSGWIGSDNPRALSSFASTPIVRIDADGISSRRESPHPECGCIGVQDLARAS